MLLDGTYSKRSMQGCQLIVGKGFIFLSAVRETSLQAHETPTPRRPSRGCVVAWSLMLQGLSKLAADPCASARKGVCEAMVLLVEVSAVGTTLGLD